MNINTKKCPYPGLRPYTEEESIYFKGRDLHIRQITKQLEERKVVMITGASGDGKSSLVYAGVIPNARAGFFQAKYNSWKFVDFKPERNPLKTLAESLAKQLGTDLNDTEKKLSYGFSSLIDIYKSSDYFIDDQSENWTKAKENDRKKQRNKAANLFILADQFEEFFTNSENFSSGNPSINAYTVVNLLLETANIAIRENLPVYIVFTMRSDFISQCVAFKGLPELIGFSQFFVPRLKRNEIKQVIEDPAILSGGKISSRLTELLINELRDGFDQLPVLQHALHQLWKLADNGNQELDLIHLAKLAGMPSKFLSKNDEAEFVNWFDQLPQYRKNFFSKPELNNVLNSHANLLYESAFDYFNSEAHWAPKNISLDDAKLILKTVFQSLTKIDEGRAVRNRMSLREITKIINKENITYEVVSGVLNIFRLPDSTFIRPFINPDDLDTQFISASTILDITHEALIRNWELLREWEAEEIKNLSNFKEFQIQLKRWLDNEKSKQFLLASGNLVHFEKWFELCKPNPYWIAKYDESTVSKSEKILKAEQIAANIKEYLHQSRSYITHIEQAKKRRKNIVLTSAFCVIFILSVLMGFAFKEKAKAEKQELLATEQSAEAQKQQQQAEQERNKAIIANKRAEEEKERAEKSAAEALVAKALSDKARKNAESMRLLAEQQSALAKQEAQKAQKEKQRADEQRSIAEIASDSARSLSMLANAQTLAFKAKQDYSNKQINLKMALKAYKLNIEYGGYLRDAAIYDGLYNSLYFSDYDNTIYKTESNIVSIQLNESNDILVYNNKNILTTLSGNDFSVINTLEQNNLVNANKAFIFSNLMVVSYENTDACIINRANNKAHKINTQSGFIRSAVIFNDYLITSARNKTIQFWNIDSLNFNPFVTMHMPDKVNKLVAADKLIFAGLKNGCIEQINIESHQYQTIDSVKGRVTAMSISKNGHYLIVASSLGEVKIYETGQSVTYLHSMNKPDIFIEALAINENNTLLAVASSDKEIAVYDMNNLNMKPINIKLSNQLSSVQAVLFNSKQQLIVCYSDNTIRIWETSNKAYAEMVQAKISKVTSQIEMDEVLGNRNNKNLNK